MNDDDLDQAVQKSFDRDAIRDAVLALADLLGNISHKDAAMGMQQALWLMVSQDV